VSSQLWSVPGITFVLNWPAALVVVGMLATVICVVVILFRGSTPRERSMILRALGEMVRGPGAGSPPTDPLPRSDTRRRRRQRQ
jgi:hypothetical protein